MSFCDDVLRTVENLAVVAESRRDLSSRALGSGAWDAVVQEIRRHVPIDDRTNPLVDVSRVLTIGGIGAAGATLQLSFVGPYGVYWTHSDDDVIIDEPQRVRNEMDLCVLRACAAHGVTMLGKDILEVPVPGLHLLHTSSGKVRVYQALFSDMEFIPGELNEHGGSIVPNSRGRHHSIRCGQFVSSRVGQEGAEMSLDDEIYRAVERCYGSLPFPRFEFASSALDSGMWDEIVHDLGRRVAAEDCTDLNSDVSRTLVIGGHGADGATLQLSFLGPYGVYWAHSGSELFMDTPARARNEVDLDVLRTCEAHGVELLGKDALYTHVPGLQLFDTSPGNVRVYQALFRDVDFIPGEYESLVMV